MHDLKLTLLIGVTLNHAFNAHFSVACVAGSCHRVNYRNGVTPPKTEGERRSPAFPHNLTTAVYTRRPLRRVCSPSVIQRAFPVVAARMWNTLRRLKSPARRR